MARLTFEEWWDSVSIEGVQANTLDNFSLSKQAVIVGFCKSAWEACESALCAEQAEAVASAVAGAYLDAANFVQANHVDEYPCSDCCLFTSILARTPADAKAAMERRDGERDAKFNTICREHNQAELDETRIDLQTAQETIERLKAELADAKRDTFILWHSQDCTLDECSQCSASLERIDAIDEAYRLYRLRSSDMAQAQEQARSEAIAETLDRVIVDLESRGEHQAVYAVRVLQADSPYQQGSFKTRSPKRSSIDAVKGGSQP